MKKKHQASKKKKTRHAITKHSQAKAAKIPKVKSPRVVGRKQTDARTARRSKNVSLPAERTLIIIKPDGMEHADRIMNYYQKKGMMIIANKTMKVDRKFAEKHYSASDEQILGMGNKTIQASKDSGQYEKMKKIFGTEDPRKIGMKLRGWLIKFITSAPVAAFVLEGKDAVAISRKITGFTDPAKAEKKTVRGDFGTDSIVKANSEGRPVMNLVHASGNKEEAEREIALWFPEMKG